MVDLTELAEVSSPSFTTNIRFGLDYSKPLKTSANAGSEITLKIDHSVWGGLFLSGFSHFLVTFGHNLVTEFGDQND